ncbi:MAG: FapA family protein [bacterium]|nr:FapA family protein [bacterium]
MDIDDSSGSEDSVEVFADSVKQALDLAAEELGIEVTNLDYEILEKGNSGFFGLGRQPYRVLITPLKIDEEHSDIDEIEEHFTRQPHVTPAEKKNADSTYQIRVTKSGVWLTVTPAKGTGKNIGIDDANNKLFSMRITTANLAVLEAELKNPGGEPVKIGEWTPNPDYDSAMQVEVTEDEMKAFIHFTPPRFSGRHMELDEALEALRNAGAVSGIDEERMTQYLEVMDYNQPLLAAEGTKPRNGRDGYIDYKVRVEKSHVNFEEDESGKVDFRNLELLENVVVGQLLALKVPAEDGIPGRTITNRIIPAKSGKDTSMQYGKGTILSEDGTELSAEINGQVVFKANRINVEPVYVVNGDVSLQTGNIVFLGSVVISGSVQDNFVVKAAGNIEVKGTVQKAFLEAEGDIIVHQGISGREEAKIESTGGSVFAKFVQNANVIAENHVIVPEGILHAWVDAGEKIYCNGRRARIVGGLIRAGDEVNSRFLGAEVSTKTEIKVGINPKVLQQLSDLESIKKKIDDELNDIQLNMKTLENQKKAGKLTGEKAKLLEDMQAQNEKLTNRGSEITLEFEELQGYIGMLEHKGKICAEKSAYPGVDIYIKDQVFPIKDEYNFIKFSLEGGEIRLSEYETPEDVGQQKIATLSRKRAGR